jgi:hypothetical protein
MQKSYQNLEEEITGIMGQVKGHLSPESLGYVEHYVSVGELEMGCEALVLSLYEERVILNEELSHRLCKICKSLLLGNSSVIRADFWIVASKYLRCGI